MGWRSPVIACAIILVAAGCSSGDVAPEAATETTVVATTSTTAAPATTGPAPIEVPLPSDVTETYSIPNFGYSIDYPAGWFAETREPSSEIVQIEEELFSDSDEGVGLGVSLDHRTVSGDGATRRSRSVTSSGMTRGQLWPPPQLRAAPGASHDNTYDF